MFFFFNDTATTEIYTLSLHDALPISPLTEVDEASASGAPPAIAGIGSAGRARSEEHTSELQSQSNLVCRLLLEKKKTCHTASEMCLSYIAADLLTLELYGSYRTLAHN